MRVLSLSLLVACKPPDGDTPIDTSTLVWTSCAGDLDDLVCVDVPVPWDAADPAAGTATLTVWRLPASGGDAEGVLFVNPGGPGGSPASLVDAVGKRLLPELSGRFDIVGVEPRGAGSRPLGCAQDLVAVYEQDVAPITAEGVAARHDVATAWADTCMAEDGDWLPYVTLPDMADDIVTVADAMGWEKVGYYGISAGAMLGALLADQHPDRVWGVAIDSVAPTVPYDDLLTLQSDGIAQLLPEWAAWCESEETYVNEYGTYDCWIKDDPIGSMNQVLEQSRSAPIVSSAGRRLDHNRAIFGLYGALYNETNWYVTADAIDQALNYGNPDPILTDADSYFGYDPTTGTYRDGSLAAYHALMCAAGSTPRTPDELLADALAAEADLPHFGPMFAVETDICDDLPAPRRPLTGPVAATGAPPILLLQSAGDVATPLPGAEMMNAGFEDSVMVVWSGSSHSTAFASECARQYLLDYLGSGVLPPDGTTCDQ